MRNGKPLLLTLKTLANNFQYILLFLPTTNRNKTIWNETRNINSWQWIQHVALAFMLSFNDKNPKFNSFIENYVPLKSFLYSIKEMKEKLTYLSNFYGNVIKFNWLRISTINSRDFFKNFFFRTLNLLWIFFGFRSVYFVQSEDKTREQKEAQ